MGRGVAAGQRPARCDGLGRWQVRAAAAQRRHAVRRRALRPDPAGCAGRAAGSAPAAVRRPLRRSPGAGQRYDDGAAEEADALPAAGRPAARLPRGLRRQRLPARAGPGPRAGDQHVRVRVEAAPPARGFRVGRGPVPGGAPVRQPARSRAGAGRPGQRPCPGVRHRRRRRWPVAAGAQRRCLRHRGPVAVRRAPEGGGDGGATCAGAARASRWKAPTRSCCC